MSGLVHDLDEQEYHRHPALSASGAKRLLPPGCPALFKWEREHPVHKDVFDFGSAAHAMVLAAGPRIMTVEADDWRSKSARDRRDAIRESGAVPVLYKDYEQIIEMAAAIKAHPVASALLDPDHGKPEVSMFWHDDTQGIDRRGRLDWLPDTDGGRLIIPDYKTCVSAEPGAIKRSVANFAYHMQDAWYRDSAHALGLAEDIAFVFIFQEKTAPYLVTVVELDDEAVRVGRVLNDRACQVFAECTATDTWPSYTSDVELISLPAWATYVGDTAA